MSPDLDWFIDNYYLSNYKYYIPNDLDTSKFHHRFGDFKSNDLSDLADNDNVRVGNFIKHYIKFANNLPAIAFGVSIKDAENIAKKFTESGFPMQSLHSKTPNISTVLKDAKSGKYRLLSTCDLIGEGTDIKTLTAMLDGRPTESTVIQIQHWGRPLRALYANGYDLSTKEGRKTAMEAGGKGDAIILDFSSNYLRHGLPKDKRNWSLKDGEIKSKSCVSQYKRCPECQQPIPVFSKVCPLCGHVFEREAQTTEPEEREGELIEISNLKFNDRNNLTIKIARGASTYKEAVNIAKENGVNQQGAWLIWRKLLHNKSI